MEEIEITCPFCGETITILTDTYISHQNFIEDCYVCCRPIQINVYCKDSEVTSIDVQKS